MKCRQCGGKLRRVHRTFVERFSYMAIYECRTCEREEYAPRRYRYHLGEEARCPVCGSYRIVKLKHPDRIDKMHTGFLNWLEKLAGKKALFHCRWCRLQFYDRRPLRPAEHVAKEQTNPGLPKTDPPAGAPPPPEPPEEQQQQQVADPAQ
jgi:DNA-directed RNA polymerase subunit RPC12/RpoP